MIERGDGDDATKAGQRHNLMQMIGYAEDELECRRKMLLGHFKEHFTKQMCKGTCDNCRRGATSEERDVSAHAKAALRLVHEARTRLTLTMVADTLRFVVLLVWIILSFSFFFWTLYREHYAFPSDPAGLLRAGCFNPADAFEDFRCVGLR